ncbi:MAG: hypothetical protein ABFC56_03855, partial [Clostridiaceae bacterium]
MRFWRRFRAAIILLIILVMLLLLYVFTSERDPYIGQRPIDQPNTVWYCPEYDTRFIVNAEGLAYGEIRQQNIMIDFTVIWSVFTPEAKLVQHYQEEGYSLDKDTLVAGNCKFAKKALTYQLTQDHIGAYDPSQLPTLFFNRIDNKSASFSMLGNRYAFGDRIYRSVHQKFAAFQPEMSKIASALDQLSSDTTLIMRNGEIQNNGDKKLEKLLSDYKDELQICKPLLVEFDSISVRDQTNIDSSEVVFDVTYIAAERLFNRYCFV